MRLVFRSNTWYDVALLSLLKIYIDNATQIYRYTLHLTYTYLRSRFNHVFNNINKCEDILKYVVILLKTMIPTYLI